MNKNEQSNGLSVLYNRARFALEIFSILFQMFVEIIYSFIKLFVKDELKDISGEVILITGTAHGIGRELAIQYVNLGCEVICLDINNDENQKTVDEANALQMGTAYGYHCDITKREKILELAERIRTEIGHVSVIVNNAGLMYSRPLLEHSEEEIRKTFDVNVFGHFWVLEAFMPHMLTKSRGHIIAISSTAGFCGLSNLVPYCTSKFAVRGFMEALYEEIRENTKATIKTTVVYPFMVDTGLCKKPKSRFPNIFRLVSVETAARKIIEAHRLNFKEASIPRYQLYLNNVIRLLPINCFYLAKDFVDTGVLPDK